MEEEIEIPPITRIMKLNLPEWPLLVIGSIFAAIAGAFPVAFAVIISEILKVCLSHCRHLKFCFSLHSYKLSRVTGEGFYFTKN